MATKPQRQTDTQDKPSFSSVLDIPSSEVSRPKPMPQGTYLCLVKGLPRIDKSTKKGTEFSEYILQIMEACDDVDQEALQESLTKGGGDIVSIRERSLRATYYHTEDSRWRLKKFLNDLGIEEQDEKGNELTLWDRMQMVPGRQVYAHVKHTPSDDGETMYANIDKTAPVE